MQLKQHLKQHKFIYIFLTLALFALINLGVLVLNDSTVSAYCHTCGNGCGTSCVPDNGGLCLNANCVFPNNCFSTYGATNCGGGNWSCGSCPTPPPPATVTCYRCNGGGWCESYTTTGSCGTNCGGCSGTPPGPPAPPPPPPGCGLPQPTVAPAYLPASCSGTSMTFTWGAVPNATNYLLRIDDPATAVAPCAAGAGPRDICIAVSGTSYVLNGINPALTYPMWVHGNNCAGYGPAGGGAGFCCTATAPTAPVLGTPANGAVLPTQTTATLTWSATTFGTGCPQNNTYQVFTGPSAAGPWTGRGATTGLTSSITGLTAGTTYYWLVQANNGSLQTNSAVRSFRTNANPTVVYNGQLETDTCTTGTSGRVGAGSADFPTVNPIRLKFTVTDVDGDTPRAMQFMMVPRSLSGGAATVPNGSPQSWTDTGQGLLGAGVIDNPSATAPLTSIASADPTSAIWTSTSTVGADHNIITSSSHVATFMNVKGSGGSTGGRLNATTTEFYFQIRFENVFGSPVMTSNLTRQWDIYALMDMRNSDGNIYYDNASTAWTRYGQWGVDLVSPNSVVTGPSYDANGTFNITYTASDIQGLSAVGNTIARSNAAATLTDNTIGQALSFTGNAHSSSVNLSNYLTQPTRNYTTNNIAGNNFIFYMGARDFGCNYVLSSINVGTPSPWMLTSGGNASVNGSVVNNATTANISVPTNFTGILTNVAQGKAATLSSTYLPGYADRAVDGNTDGQWTSNSTAHSQLSANPWFHVDLGQVYNLTNLSLWNRLDCCQDRLENFYVFVSDVPFSSTAIAATQAQSGVSSFLFSGQAGSPSVISVNRTGRYIRVQLNSASNYINIAELQAFGSISQSFSLTGLPGFTYSDGTAGPYFSTYGVLSGTSQTVVSPTSKISKLNRYVINYLNEGVDPRSGGGWYDYLLPIVQSNSNPAMATFATTTEVAVGNPQFPTGQQYSGNLSTIFGIPAGTKRNVNATGNIWLAPGTVCDIKSIIFISGNLRIDPSLTQTAGNACVFVVNGNISIGTGSNGGQITVNTGTQPTYDIISATLISDDFVWADNNPIASMNPWANWTFNESAGTVVSDSSGNGRNGTWVGSAPFWAAGQNGNSGNFNGSNSYVNVGNLGLTGSATVLFSIRPTTAGTEDRRVLSQLSGATNQAGALRFMQNGMEVWDGGAWRTNLPYGTVPTNNWSRVAMVYTGTQVKAYLNGTLRLTYNSGFNFNGVQMGIGARFLNVHGLPFSGQIDEFRVYNTALTDAQIATDANDNFKGEGLYIKGSVVTTGDFEWNRDLNGVANAFHPAVVIFNDPIYTSLFKTDLWLKDYSIREQE